MTAYDKFGYDEEYGCYTYQGSKGRHIVPFPVVQDIHLSFVFRFRSIGKKVQGGAERYDEWDTRQKKNATNAHAYGNAIGKSATPCTRCAAKKRKLRNSHATRSAAHWS